MTTLDGYYLNPHRSQYDGSPNQYTNCTPTAVANAANAATGGAYNKTGGQVRSLLRSWEETTPGGGWSIWDADKAMGKVGIGFINASMSGRSSTVGWNALINVLESGHSVVLQGESSAFSDKTCSGTFNGDHCIHIHPASRDLPAGRQRWIDDGVCKEGRWEFESTLKNYAMRYNTSIRFGYFTDKVHKLVETHHVAIAHGASLRFYTLSGSCIRGWTDQTWSAHDSGASCGPIIPRPTCSGSSKGLQTVIVSNGMFAGRCLRVGSKYGVTVS